VAALARCARTRGLVRGVSREGRCSGGGRGGQTSFDESAVDLPPVEEQVLRRGAGLSGDAAAHGAGGGGCGAASAAVAAPGSRCR
jgi:hypothetical protein